jgi:hypothetical protein
MSGSSNVLSELPRRNGQPFSGLAVKLHPVEIAFDRSKEDVVQGGWSHGAGGPVAAC